MTYEQDGLAAENERLRERIAELESGDTPSIDVQIADAESAGDWNTAIGLKLGKLAEAQTGGEPAGPDVDTLLQIAKAEEEGNVTEAIRLKIEASRPQPSPVDPEIAAQIAQLEAEGKWFEAGRLKVQLVGIPL